MSSKFVGYGKKLFDLARGGGKSNVCTTIVGVDVAKNLATKINEKVNIPWINEEKEQELFEKLVDVMTDMLEGVFKGK